MKHVDFYESETMREFAKIAKLRGLVTEVEISKVASDETDDLQPSESLFADIARIAVGLRDKGLVRPAERLEGMLHQYQRAEVVVASLLEEYHPEGSVKVSPAKDDNGTVETKDLQQKKDREVAEKQPTGKLGAAFREVEAIVRSAQLAGEQQDQPEDDTESFLDKNDPSYSAKQEAAKALEESFDKSISSLDGILRDLEDSIFSVKKLQFDIGKTRNPQYASFYATITKVSPEEISDYWRLVDEFPKLGSSPSVIESKLRALEQDGAKNLVERVFPQLLGKYFPEGVKLASDTPYSDAGWSAVKTITKLNPLVVPTLLGDAAGAYTKKVMEEQFPDKSSQKSSTTGPSALSYAALAVDIFNQIGAKANKVFGLTNDQSVANAALQDLILPKKKEIINEPATRVRQLSLSGEDIAKNYKTILIGINAFMHDLEKLAGNKNQYSQIESMVGIVTGNSVSGKIAADLITMNGILNNEYVALLEKQNVFNINGKIAQFAKNFATFAGALSEYKGNSVGLNLWNECRTAAAILNKGKFDPVADVMKQISGSVKLLANVKTLSDLTNANNTIASYIDDLNSKKSNEPAETGSEILARYQQPQSTANQNINFQKTAQVTMPKMPPDASAAKPSVSPQGSTKPANTPVQTNLPKQLVAEVQKMQANLARLAATQKDSELYSQLASVGNRTAPDTNDGIWGPNTSRSLKAAQTLMAPNGIKRTLDVSEHRHDSADVNNAAAKINNDLLEQLIQRLGGKSGVSAFNLMKPLFTIKYQDYSATVFLRDVVNMSGFYDFLKRISSGKAEEMGPEGDLGIRIGTFKEALAIILNQATDKLNGVTHSIKNQWTQLKTPSPGSDSTELLLPINLESPAGNAATNKDEIDAINQCRSLVIKLLNALNPYGTNTNIVITKEQAESLGSTMNQKGNEGNGSEGQQGSGGQGTGEHQMGGTQWASYQTNGPGGGEGSLEGHDSKVKRQTKGPPFNNIIDFANQHLAGAREKLGMSARGAPILDLRYFSSKSQLSQSLFSSTSVKPATIKAYALLGLGVVTKSQQPMTFGSLTFQPGQDLVAWDPKSQDYFLYFKGSWVPAAEKIPNYQEAIIQQAGLMHAVQLERFLNGLPGVLTEAINDWIETENPDVDDRQEQNMWLQRWIEARDTLVGQP
jgi:hypothetical protein